MLSNSAHADHFVSGIVDNVSDGDTFTIKSGAETTRVRICGVDSPERGQRGYAGAAGELAQLIEGKEVRCIQVGGGTPCDGRSKATSRDRIVAQCFIGTKDIGMEMICAGKAVDIPKFSNGYYVHCKR